MRALTLVAAVGLSATLQAPTDAQSQQRFADLGTCPTSRGEVVRECRVGYRTALTCGSISTATPTSPPNDEAPPVRRAPVALLEVPVLI